MQPWLDGAQIELVPEELDGHRKDLGASPNFTHALWAMKPISNDTGAQTPGNIPGEIPREYSLGNIPSPGNIPRGILQRELLSSAGLYSPK